MARSVEVLITRDSSESGLAILNAMASAARSDGWQVAQTQTYAGKSDLLVLFGVGAADRDAARKKHIASGRHAVCWDQGYFQRKKITGYVRCSIDHDHPQAWLGRTKPDPSRWEALKIPLREDYVAEGPIILVGLGRKSRSYLGLADWERQRLAELRLRFPRREIVYRPKKGSPALVLNVRTDADSPIEELLVGASLVSCRHSNVACDAAVAGVSFECEDGAAMYLQRKPFTRENRLDFLWRLAWWQWRASEAAQAWRFIRGVLGHTG